MQLKENDRNGYLCPRVLNVSEPDTALLTDGETEEEVNLGGLTELMKSPSTMKESFSRGRSLGCPISKIWVYEKCKFGPRMHYFSCKRKLPSKEMDKL